MIALEYKNSIAPYLIGQRVIYRNVICVVCMPENDTNGWVWIDNPAAGYKHGASKDNIKPLPNGQL